MGLHLLDIFEAVQSGEAFHGVIPFENSTNGCVVHTLDLFADRSNLYPDVSVCAEAYLDIHHYLLGHLPPSAELDDSPEVSCTSTPTPNIPKPLKPRTDPLVSLKHVKTLYSHPQAFGQSEIFLGAYLKGVERIDVSSTSKAAELVKEDKSHTSAAIASQIAAQVYGLSVLAQNIEDQEDNTTRFFILRKGMDHLDKPEISRIPQQFKNLLSFMLDHRSPGALADVLDCFKRYKLNLTSINSRPSRLLPFQYIFFVEFEGDPHGIVKEALNSLDKIAKRWRWLGSWEDRPRQ